MVGLQFEKCNEFGFAVKFENCQLNHSSFYGMKLNRCSFNNSILEGIDFIEANLAGSALTNCNLSKALFENTNLEKADLRGSANYSIDPETNRIKGAKFSLPEVGGLLDKYGISIE